MGGSDFSSFEEHEQEYNRTLWELSERFEDTYVSLIKAVRTLAYPKHPTPFYGERLGLLESLDNANTAAVPIFVMRPFRGQLEQATQNVVNKLRLDGDKAVYWLDTTGWLVEEAKDRDPTDLYYDESTSPATWRLTEQGNQRVAIFLHMHVCRYLAAFNEKCAFLPQEVYQGKVFDPQAADFDQYLETERENKLKALFWPTAANLAEDGLLRQSSDLRGE